MTDDARDFRMALYAVSVTAVLVFGLLWLSTSDPDLPPNGYIVVLDQATGECYRLEAGSHTNLRRVSCPKEQP